MKLDLDKNLSARKLILDEKDEDIMWPEPSPEQDLLWDKLADLVSVEDLTRELKWFEISDNIKKYLSSSEVSLRINKIGKKFNLNLSQIKNLAKNIKYVFIKEVPLNDFIVKIVSDLKLDKNLAIALAGELKSEIFMPQREFLVLLYPPIPKSVVSEKEKVTSPIQPEVKNVASPRIFQDRYIKVPGDKSFEIPQIRPAPIILSPKPFVAPKTTINEKQPVKEKPIAVELKPSKFKVVPEAPIRSEGVTLDHLYDKIHKAKEERKNFLSEVIIKKEDLPKAWKIESNVKIQEREGTKEQRPIKIPQNRQEAPLKSPDIPVPPAPESPIFQKAIIKTMKKDLEKIKSKDNPIS